MLRSVKIAILPGQALPVLFCLLLFLVLYLPSALSQKAQPGGDVPRKYDLHLEKKSEGVAEQVNLLPFGTGKDFIELIITEGDQLHVYVCPKLLQEEMGISFSKGDEVVIAGSKSKQGASDVTFVREFVKGTDTLSFRDDEGQPQYGIRIPASEPRSRGADETF